MADINSDLGPNLERLVSCVESLELDNILLDLGVRDGISSRALLTAAEECNNKVYGVDLGISPVNEVLAHEPNYSLIRGESVAVGRTWDKGPVNLVFVDTTHVREYTMCELYYWWEHIAEGGWMIFHDSAEDYQHSSVIPGLEGNGKNGTLRPVCEGIKDFFGVDSQLHRDEYIDMFHYPESNGMTFVMKLSPYPYREQRDDWGTIFAGRRAVLKWYRDTFAVDVPE